MRYEDNMEGRTKWINEILSPALAQMPRCSIKSLEYVDRSSEMKGQAIIVTYDDGYSREVNVSADSSKACLYDLVYSHTLE